MSTLISFHNSSGCAGRCDANCHNSKSSNCTCICGGKNHGVGEQQAIENTREMAVEWMEKYKRERGI